MNKKIYKSGISEPEVSEVWKQNNPNSKLCAYKMGKRDPAEVKTGRNMREISSMQ